MDTKQVIDLLKETLDRHLAHPGQLAAASESARSALPAEQVANIDHVLDGDAISYRDVIAIQLAYALCSRRHLDLKVRHEGARGAAGVAGRFAAMLRAAHIRHIQDAYQNIGKNTPRLDRGNVPQYDSFLRWASDRERVKSHLHAAFEYVIARIAATARPVSAMPPLNTSALGFAQVFGLLSEMFAHGSQGAYEQFATAALLHALIQEAAVPGYRVETKSLNASDRSSRVAGDIQILAGTRVVEAYEVTAADWGAKIDGAEQTIRENDLLRLHVVANTSADQQDEILRRLKSLRSDVSVLDLKGFAASLVSALTRQFRAVALERLYEFLDRYQPDTRKVNTYVALLEQNGLTQREAP